MSEPFLKCGHGLPDSIRILETVNRDGFIVSKEIMCGECGTKTKLDLPVQEKPAFAFVGDTLTVTDGR